MWTVEVLWTLYWYGSLIWCWWFVDGSRSDRDLPGLYRPSSMNWSTRQLFKVAVSKMKHMAVDLVLNGIHLGPWTVLIWFTWFDWLTRSTGIGRLQLRSTVTIIYCFFTLMCNLVHFFLLLRNIIHVRAYSLKADYKI